MWRFALILAASPAIAQDLPPLICVGVEPQWSVALDGDVARFTDDTANREVEFTIPHRSVAEGRTSPHALSLIAARDSAVALIDQRQCTDTMSDIDYPYAVDFLTQRRGVAILLTGCCGVGRE